MTYDADYEPQHTPVPLPKPSGLLPREIERRLILASQLPVQRDRLRAIDEAIDFGRMLYPDRWVKQHRRR